MHFHYLVQVDGEKIGLNFLNALYHQYRSKPNLQMILSNILKLNIRMIFKHRDSTKEEDP